MGQTEIPAIAIRRYPGTVGGEPGSVAAYKAAMLITGLLFLLSLYLVVRGNWEEGVVIVAILFEALVLISFFGLAREMRVIREEESTKLWVDPFYEFKVPRDWPLVSITRRILEGLRSHGMWVTRIDVRGYQIPPESPYRGIMLGMRIEPGDRQIYVVLAEEKFLFADRLPPREAAAIVVTPIEVPFELEAEPVAVLVAKVLWNQEVMNLRAGRLPTLSERELMGFPKLPARMVLDPRYTAGNNWYIPRRR